MKAYLVPEAPFGERWQYTQADAKAKGREVGGLFEQKALPSAIKDRILFLNTMEREVYETVQRIVQVAAVEPAPTPPPAPSVPLSGPLSMIAVEEAIQNATLPQLASYASNVAWRFKELGEGRS